MLMLSNTVPISTTSPKHKGSESKHLLSYNATDDCDVSTVSYQQLCSEVFLTQSGEMKRSVLLL